MPAGDRPGHRPPSRRRGRAGGSDRPTPETLAEAVTALGGAAYALAVPGRADDPVHRADAVRQVGAAFGPVDLLVNNTGINPCTARCWGWTWPRPARFSTST
ncbi:hypothetical protein NKG94_06685 [Micromonospora sp. M12]